MDFSTSPAVVISRRQLIYYIIPSTVCQQLFLFSFASFSEAVVVCVTYFTRQLIYNIMYRSVCQQLFQKKIEQLISSNKAEKEGFEPSRRLTRPIPLAGAPLRPLEYFSKVHNCQYDVVRYVCDAFNILLNFYLFVNPYFLYFILPVTVAVTVHRLPCEL